MIVVFGSINLDLIFALDHLPEPGQTVLGPATRIEPGGKGANQAVAAARDGAAVAMAGCVGRDALADAALATLLAADVDLSRVVRGDLATGCAAICTDPAGRNQIAVGSGANTLARADQVEDALLAPGTTLLLQMEADPQQTAVLIRRARARGARIILNLAPARPLEPTALRAIDLLVVNETEADWLTVQHGATADAAGLHAALGVGVVRTLGERGAEWATRAGGGHVAAHPVQAIDTTAAGDCFTGVLAAALDRGMEMESAMARASVAAALCCSRAGSQNSLPLVDEIEQAAL
jgi:ribokinase